MQLTRELQDKSLRIEFSDGEIADIKALVVSECGEHEDCGEIADIKALVVSECGEHEDCRFPRYQKF